MFAPFLDFLPPVFAVRDFRLLWTAFVARGFAVQMMAVAIGWQVYEIRHNPLDLGLVGLAEFIPLPLLALPFGTLADRLPRRLVFATSIALDVAVAGALLAVTVLDLRRLWPFLVLAAAAGIADGLGSPAARALPPVLVPADMLASAIAFRSIGMQIAIISGPAVGGILFAIRPELVYVAALALLALALVRTIALRAPAAVTAAVTGTPPSARDLVAGVTFILHTPVMLGAISLDLFAVLFGGAVALLPVFAVSILHVGPVGLGVLRSGPAVGALLAALLLARRPIGGSAGRKLLLVVAVFGASIVVFGLSHWFLLSLLALAVSGFADMFSMNIRSTVAALATPDELRGRVNAVEMVFISASNELGAFESGLAASIFGTVTAVVGGGLLTIAIAFGWWRAFPALRDVDRLETLRPAVAET